MDAAAAEWIGFQQYRPREQFRRFHARKQRWAAMVAHRRCGKTVACVADLILAAVTTRKQDARFAYVAPQLNQSKDVAWVYVKRLTADIPGVVYNETELRADFTNGARVRLYGADNSDRLRGLYLDGIILDEYADMAPRVWGEVIRPLLADRMGWAVFIGTPKGRNEFWRIYSEAVNDPDWFTLKLKASETGIVSTSELTAARKTMTEDQYEQEFECSFEAAILGAFYGKELNQADKEGRITDVAYDKALPVHTVWDLGWTDDTVIVWFQVTRGEVRIIDHYEANGHDVAHYCDVVKAKPYAYGKHWLPHDAQAGSLVSGGKSVIEQMQANGMKGLAVLPNKNTEQQGIMAARLMLPKTWIDRTRCHEFTEALRQFQREWDDERKCFKEKPKKDWTNHNADVLRYLAWVVKDPAIEASKEPGRVLTVGGKSTIRFGDLKWDAGNKTGRI